MGRTRIAGICLAAVVAASCAGVTSASAEIPELGRCVKSEPVKEGKKTIYHGGFVAQNCIRTSPAKKGKYEWLPGPGPNNKFYGIANEPSPEFETTGGVKISCATVTVSGEYTGAKSEKINKIGASGCEAGVHRPCQTNPAKEGEIEGLAELEGELRAISKTTTKPSAGWDLKHEGAIFAFQCGKPPELLNLETIEGPSVIGAVTNGFFSDLDKMSLYATTKFTQKAGKQIPEAFEGGAKDTLVLKSTTENTTEQLGLQANIESVSGKGEPIESEANQEPLEVKALEK
jgi:hypothetical protein